MKSRTELERDWYARVEAARLRHVESKGASARAAVETGGDSVQAPGGAETERQTPQSENSALEGTRNTPNLYRSHSLWKSARRAGIVRSLCLCLCHCRLLGADHVFCRNGDGLAFPFSSHVENSRRRRSVEPVAVGFQVVIASVPHEFHNSRYLFG